MGDWQDMSTAPTGSWAKILGWCVYPAGAEVRMCQRKPRPFNGYEWVYNGLSQTVTYWMPVPDGPASYPSYYDVAKAAA